jgi:hypothetical protein
VSFWRVFIITARNFCKFKKEIKKYAPQWNSKGYLTIS